MIKTKTTPVLFDVKTRKGYFGQLDIKDAHGILVLEEYSDYIHTFLLSKCSELDGGQPNSLNPGVYDAYSWSICWADSQVSLHYRTGAYEITIHPLPMNCELSNNIRKEFNNIESYKETENENYYF